MHEASAIVAIGATMLSTLAAESHTPFFSVVEPLLAKAIEGAEPEIIAALGGEDEALSRSSSTSWNRLRPSAESPRAF